jgi:ABC-type methionine transport system ATPase subunit
MLELINITKGYGSPDSPGYVPVLNSLSLKLQQGNPLPCLGHPGAGRARSLISSGRWINLRKASDFYGAGSCCT